MNFWICDKETASSTEYAEYRNGHISIGFKLKIKKDLLPCLRNNSPSFYLYLLPFAVNFEDGKDDNRKEVLKISLGSELFAGALGLQIQIEVCFSKLF